MPVKQNRGNSLLAALPDNESDRLASLYSYDVLDTPPQPSFDRLTCLAAAMFSAPISLITLIDSDRQFLKSSHGIHIGQLAREYAFCAHAIHSSKVTVVCDATRDRRFADNPLVLGNPKIRFYVAVPLQNSAGFRLGTFCVLDIVPRRAPHSHQLAALKNLADQVVELLEFHRARRDLTSARDQLVTRSRELEESRQLRTTADATHQREVIQDLEDAKGAAEVASRTKDRLLANVSHELRTPLNGVLGMNDLLLHTDLNQEQFEMATAVREAANGLLTVVSEMLDLSNIEAGYISIEHSPFNLRTVIQQAVAKFAAEANRKGITLITRYPDDLPASYLGDAPRIRQILINYLSNAVKFTPDGEICIEALGDMNAGSMDLLLSVSDSGPGIESAAQSRLFESFSQIDDSITRSHGGLGLGLAVSKRLAELMGGSVGVMSVPGDGSVFLLRLPLECHLPAAAHADSLSNDPLAAHRVLLVEDNLINQKVAVGALRRLGCEADVASDGQEAFDLFLKNHYSLIFMDCQMPRMDGFTATRHIRRWEATNDGPNVFIVALTAHAMPGDRERCLAAGMNDYLSKPFGLGDLSLTLNRCGIAHT